MTGKDLEPVRWRNGALEVVDQTLLPTRLVYVRLGNVEHVCAAITTMKVRGAPLIGVVGAYGLVLSVKKIRTRDLAEARTQLRKWADLLIQTRPTGVNLRWAVERVFNASIKAGDVSSLKDTLAKEADAIFNRELEAARKIENCIDRKSTRLNSSHLVISYAVFCLQKKRTCTRHRHPSRYKSLP